MDNVLVDEKCNIPNVTVYSAGGKIYSCVLNQTNIGKNKNKFYVIQVLYEPHSGAIFVYTRYGRVGEQGKSQHTFHQSSSYSAVREFQRKFRSKTGNSWTGNIKDFIPKPGKYVMMDIVSPELEKIEGEELKMISKLEPRILDAMMLIFNKKLMASTMRILDVDTEKLPLGKISSSQIQEAHKILSEIKSWMEISNDRLKRAGIKDVQSFRNNELVNLSSQFWTIIPFSCGRKVPPVIETFNQIEKYADLLEIMENIKIAGKIFTNTRDIDGQYENIGVDFQCIDKGSEEWNNIQEFILNTHAPTHGYNLELLDVFRLYKEVDDTRDAICYFDKLSNHRLLAHGSRMANYMGILAKGIRIPNERQVSNGSVLGLGAYFADSISKSFNYCQPHETNDIGFVILCEVALGDNPHVVTMATHDKKPSIGYTSRIALGRNAPDKGGDRIIETNSSKEVRFPCGKIKPTNVSGGGFRYNEYVVYDSRQYRFRYLLKLKCSGNKVSCW